MERTVLREDYVEAGEVDYSNLPYILSLIVLILSLLIFFVWRKVKSDHRDILLTGLSEAGKTYLFSQFLFAQDKETFSSISTNISEYTYEKGSLRFIDIPGNERLRYKYFDEHKNLAKGIVFVIDSVTLQKDVQDVADFLYTILADRHLSNVPVLILCNKQDETLAKGSTVIKSLLEKEFNIVRIARGSLLDSVNGGSDNRVFLGKQGTDFAFSQLSQNIDIAECSAKERDFNELNDWLKSL